MKKLVQQAVCKKQLMLLLASYKKLRDDATLDLKTG
jgi:hypothetical protein